MRIRLLTLLPMLAPALLAQGIPESVEPNDTVGTATAYAPGFQAEGTIGVPGDVDWYVFSISSVSDLMVTTGWAVGATIDLDTVVTLYQSDGITVVAQNDDRGFDRFSRLDAASVPANDLVNPFYILEVKDFYPTDTGGYTLDLQAKAPTIPVVEAAETNDPRVGGGVATVGAINTLHSGFLVTGGALVSYTSLTADYDFYQIAVPAPMTLIFETKDSVPSRATDTVIHMANAAFTQLALDDDSGALALSRLTYAFTTPGTYYVVVAGYGATSGIGNYELSIRTALPTVVASPGGCAGSGGTPKLSVRAPIGFPTATELPWLGTQFFVDETALPASAVYFRLIGFSDLAVPFNLGVLGAPGCLVEVSHLSSGLSFASPAGTGFWGFALPANPAYEGTELHYQLAVLDPPANALGITTSNKLVATVRMQ